MANGNVSGAIKLLSPNMEYGILPLKQKHPHGNDVSDSILLPDSPITVHEVRFEAISSKMIPESALKREVALFHLVWMATDGAEF